METHGETLEKGVKPNISLVRQPGGAKKAIDDPIAAKTLLQLSMPLRLRFKVSEKLGAGSFGHIFKAFDAQRSEYVALKFESHPADVNDIPLTLEREAKILTTIGGVPGIPTVHFFKKEENYSLMELNLLGPNLEKLFRSCNRMFSTKTVFLLAEEMLSRIEYVHSRGYLHRDIKPENFVIGSSSRDPRTIYLIDFGLSKLYLDPMTGKHIPFKENKALVGTARYASIWTHLGMEQSRRDDLEAVGYMLIYFIKGSLPWQNIQSKCKNEKYKLIADSKINTTIETLCEGTPRELELFMKYVRSLAFTDTPDYKYLKGLFRTESEWGSDDDYDWNIAFSKFEDLSKRSMEGAYKSKLKMNCIPANYYTKRQTSTCKGEDSAFVELPIRHETKGFGPYLQNKENNIHVVRKHHIELKESIVRHSNSIDAGNFVVRLNRVLSSRVNNEGEGSRLTMRKVPRLNLCRTMLQEFNGARPISGDEGIDLNAMSNDSSYTEALFSPGYRSWRNMMPEKPAFNICCVAKGESEDSGSSSLSLQESHIQDTNFLRNACAAHKKADISPRLNFRPSKTFQSDPQDYDFTGDDINERNNLEVAIYHLPQAPVKKLEELEFTRNRIQVQQKKNNKLSVPKMLRSAHSMRDCRDIVIFKNSLVSTGTDVHKVSFVGDS